MHRRGRPWLLLVMGFILFLAGLSGAQMEGGNEGSSKTGSRPVSKGPSENDRLINDKLRFIIPYYEWYEAFAVDSNGSAEPGKKGVFVGLLGAVVIVQFYLTISISSAYLTPSLAHLSSLLCMSPDLAGLTFLAFGNGAPDFFTAVLGAGEAPEMILSSSVGSGLFLVTFVLGLLIVLAKVTDPGLPGGLLLSRSSLHSTVKIGRGTFWRNGLMYSGCVVALGGIVLSRGISWWQALVLLVVFGVYLAAAIAAYYIRRTRGAKKPAAVLEQPVQEGDGVADAEPLSGTLPTCLELEKRRLRLQSLPPGRRLLAAVRLVSKWDGRGEGGSRLVVVLGRVLWCVTSPVRLLLNLTIFPLPPIECTTAAEYGDYSVYPVEDALVARMALGRWLIPLNPAFCLPVLAYISGLGGLLVVRTGWLWSVFVWGSVSALLGCVLHLISCELVNPGSVFSRAWQSWLVRLLATVYAFCGCLAWIYVVSNELVAVLSSLALILGVSRTILGGLVLAWGNSVGDLTADVALVRSGAVQTAITAIFSGPVQNCLLTLGAAFLVAAWEHGGVLQIGAGLRADLHLALLLLVLAMAMLLVIVPGYFNFRIPRWFGWALMASYVLYLPAGVVLGLRKD